MDRFNSLTSLQQQGRKGPPAVLQSNYIAATLTTGPDPAAPPQLLGSGGFGSVYLFKDKQADSLVAIKRIRLSGLTDSRAQELAVNIPQE